MKPFFIIFAGFALCICGATSQLRGQTAADVSATVQFGNGQTVVLDDFSDLIGVQPGEVVQVTIQVPLNHAGEAIKIGSLDGGQISNASTAVGDQGSITFDFQAPAGAGEIRVIVRFVSNSLRLQFWVLNLQNPQDNVPVITPQNSGN